MTLRVAVTLVLLALATSIDALAIGFSLGMVGVIIWYPAVVIGRGNRVDLLAGDLPGKPVWDKNLGNGWKLSGVSY